MAFTVSPTVYPLEGEWGLRIAYPIWGIAWAEEFVAILNARRAQYNLAPIEATNGDKYLRYVDIAQRHAENEGAAAWSDHNWSGFPVGWQTFRERAYKWGGHAEQQLVGTENILVSISVYSYSGTQDGIPWAMDAGYITENLMTPQTAFDSWWESHIGHRENMMLNWADANITVWVGFGYGIRPENKAPQLVPAENYQAIYIVTDYGPTEVPEMEILLNTSYNLNGAMIETLISSYSLYTNTQVLATHSLSYSLRFDKAHSAPYGCRVGLAHVVPLTYSVAKANIAGYVGTGPVKQSYGSLYHLLRGDPLLKEHRVRYGVAVGRAFSSPYEPLPSVRAKDAAPYTDLAKVRVSTSSPYEPLSRVRNSSVVRYLSPSSVQGSVRHGYSMLVPVQQSKLSPYSLTNRVRTACGGKWDLNNLNQVRVGNKTFWSIDSTAAAPLNVTASLQVNNRSIPLSDAVVSQNEGDSPWEARIRLTDRDDFVPINDGDEVVLTLGGEDYYLIVTGKSVTRNAPANVDLQISAKSPVVLFDSPFASTFDFTNTAPLLAKDAAEQLLGFAIAIWEAPNWLVPARRLSFEKVTPLEAVKRLVGAAGAIIVAEKNGSLAVRSKFPIPVNQYAETVVPDELVFTGTKDNISISEEHEVREEYNQFRIMEGESAYNDKMEYIPDEIPTGELYDDGKPVTTTSPNTGTLRVYPSPYRYNFRVRASSVASVGMDQKGEIVHDETQELITFVKGAAGLSYPISSLVSVVWHSESLGSVSFDVGGTSLTTSADNDNQGYGLATITYKTQAFEYAVVGVKGTSALMLMEDL